MKSIYAVLLLLFITSCSPKIKSNIVSGHSALEYSEEVYVLGIYQEVNENAEKLGEIKIKDSGFSTKCSYEEVIDRAKIAARERGGNLLKIKEHKLPGFESSCHRIVADVYKMDPKVYLDSNELEPVHEEEYAILNIYRFNGVGVAVSYSLHLGDSVLCKVKNNFKAQVKVSPNEKKVLWAKTESKVELPVNLEAGRYYYIRCSVGMGALVGRPILELVDWRTGRVEFENFNAKRR